MRRALRFIGAVERRGVDGLVGRSGGRGDWTRLGWRLWAFVRRSRSAAEAGGGGGRGGSVLSHVRRSEVDVCSSVLGVRLDEEEVEEVEVEAEEAEEASRPKLSAHLPHVLRHMCNSI